ncbi:hypothetical protein QYE76_010208 [Lolium multiflorum]|uniref:F-box domain-containing protein n=1 Tax=Lolium multiflorum TaxID=4521 RepID=A0AAD8X1X0_LOLMU|nr:hypothetical protein QYE76_009559 [Lolium multiflorum]KAK1693511.1 hypothetical protein QYE76_010208 [Lolium multiflorum]
MEACSVARIMSLGHLDLSILHKLLALSPGSHMKFRIDPPLVETETLVQDSHRKFREDPALMEAETVVPNSYRKFRKEPPRMETGTTVVQISDRKFREDPSLMEAETVVQNSPELPLDVLMDIFAQLEIPDFIRAGSVCSAWRSAYTILHSQIEQYKRRQTPCLLYTSESVADNVACLYSLAEKRVYNITLPDPPIRSRYLIGSSHGWLVTADDKSELHLLNPITGQQIALPPVITIEHVKPILDDAGAISKYELWDDLDVEIHDLDKLRDCLYFRAFVFPDSSTGSYIVVVTLFPYSRLMFARVGDCKWTLLPPGEDYEQCIHMDGLLYAFTRTGQIYAFDLAGPTFTRNVIADEMENYISGMDGLMYVVQAPCGDLLQVCRGAEVTEDILVETDKIMVYKADMSAKKLVKMNGLRDHVLFLGRSQSQCLSAEEYPQLKTNCVYFTDDDTYITRYKNDRRDIGILNLENGGREEIASKLWCNWPNPIWITPNITRMNMGVYK